MKMKSQIRETVERIILQEAEKKSENKHRKCNKLINKIKGDIDTLSEMLEDMGIDTEAKPYKQLQKMYDIMTGFDPIQKKLKEYFNMPTENSAANMLQTEEDIKIPVDSDRETEQKAIEMSTNYNKDIELSDKDEENNV
jgi:putative lipase involved disintegration of autophagic bodies